MRIADLFRRQAAARPAEVAFSCREATLTWSMFDQRTDALAAVLAERLAPGERVALLTRSCHRHWETIVAASKAGLISVPLNYRWLAHEIEYVLADSAAGALVLDESLPSADGVMASPAAGKPELVLGFSGDSAAGSGYEARVAGAAGEWTWREACEVNVLGYTSGTTGRPKGAMLGRSPAMMSALWFATLFGLQAGDRFLACMPVYVYRGGAAGLAPAVAGASTVLMDFDAGGVLDAIERTAVTHVVLAPVMVDRLLAHPDLHRRDLSSLRGIWIGGAPSTPGSVVRLQSVVGPIVGSIYGMTEATGIASMRWDRSEDGATVLRSAGRPSPLLDVRVVADDGEDAAAGEPGEVTVRGQSTMMGYWPEPGSGLRDGWFSTGDIATRDAEGRLYLVDRRGDIVNSGGLNVYTLEVEQALHEHRAVVECAVVGAPDELFGETVAAFVVLRDDRPEIRADLEAHCGRSLSGYKRPRRWIFVDSLPRNAMGKVEKRTLSDRLRAHRDRRDAGEEGHVIAVTDR